MMNGFLREGVRFVLASDQEFAIWSTNKVRTMVRIPAGSYVCTATENKHTFETIATIVKSSDDQVVFSNIIFESSYWHNSYCTGREYCYPEPFAVGDEVTITSLNRKHTVTSIHPPVYKIVQDIIHKHCEAAYTLSGGTTMYWHHQLVKT